MANYAVFMLPDGRPAVTFQGKVILQLSAHDDDARRLAAWLVDVLEIGLGKPSLELAAPDMLAALERLLAAHDADVAAGSLMALGNGNAADHARAAIAKAKGGAA